MVAANPKFNLNVNPAKDHQLGHNPDEDSRWTPVICRKIQVSELGITRVLLETLAKDQNDNYIILYSAELKDRENYDWHDWVRPSMWEITGGWSDALFDHYRKKAMQAFQFSESQIP